MGFDSGAVTFTPMVVTEALSLDPEFLQGKLLVHALPADLSKLGPDGVAGWVGHRHAEDRDFTLAATNAVGEATGMDYGAFLRFGLTCATIKVPASTLKARCRAEEIAAGGVLTRKQRAEIKEAVWQDLARGMPPSLASVSVALFAAKDLLLVDAVSEFKLDALALMLSSQLGVKAVPLSLEWIFTAVASKPPAQLACARFGDAPADDLYCTDPGADFLMWCLWLQEREGGHIKIKRRTVAVAVMGPLVLTSDDDSEQRVGLPSEGATLQPEFAVALRQSRKITRAVLMLADEDSVFHVTLDVGAFGCRSLKLPPECSDALTRRERTAERVAAVLEFFTLFQSLFGEFARLRAGKGWADVEASMREWVRKRRGSKG